MTQPNQTIQRPPRRFRPDPIRAGLPDPRPLTGYAVAVSEIDANTRVTITLDQPCIIRGPHWAFIDAVDGSRLYAPAMSVVNNTTFFYQFVGKLSPSVGFIEVPYQDVQVQNFQGGFVQPGGRWFRPPT